MHILFLSRWFPWPTSNGSKLRIYNLLQGLSKHHEVTLISFVDQPDSDPLASELIDCCQEVCTVPWKSFNPESLKSRIALLDQIPRYLQDTYSQAMAELIQRKITERHIDFVLASQIETASYRRFFRTLPAIFEEVEISLLYENTFHADSTWGRFRKNLTWIKHRRYLSNLLNSYQACTVASEKEKLLLSKELQNHTRVTVIPNCVDLSDYEEIKSQPQPHSLVFTGSFRYKPNYEAMQWFLGEVFPLIRAEISDVKLTITGDHSDLPLPDMENVNLIGFVEDIRPVVVGSSISIAPLLSGGGTRLKILEAMALKVPVVASTKGAEGLDVQNGTHLLIADSPRDFANAVVRLFDEPELGKRLSHNAYKLVFEKYNWYTVMPVLLGLIQDIVQN